MTQDITVRILEANERSLLNHIAAGVFDNPINPEWCERFLAESNHHLAIALANNEVVGMASAIDYVHPDKPPELWINEIGVTFEHRRKGIALQLLHALFEKGLRRGCKAAWVLTDQENEIAKNLFRRSGGRQEKEPVYFSFDLGAE